MIDLNRTMASYIQITQTAFWATTLLRLYGHLHINVRSNIITIIRRKKTTKGMNRQVRLKIP